ncbi:uncharacterized protein LOC129775371 [Toxorhynchites rutilus septentrionalis]|uniref:uncharacterized protein LOC129775371 n=1 Tax=Toxorhynchites rutilus septentrionalis TaxID=329112 RepID=UPI002478ABA7|nr:uncharacterized protein LOC129775371 [Toxorhynchites rutilus septentrionalis]
MEPSTFTIWDPSQSSAKMKIINIPGQGPTQMIESVSGIGSTGISTSAEQIILQTHDGREYLVDGIGHIDQSPPENLIYMAADDGSLIQGEVIHVQGENSTTGAEVGGEIVQQDQEYMECEVTEEVITDDWVQTDGQECVQVTVDQLGAMAVIGAQDDDITVPLPTDQDEYTTLRPYPCDFCSRRFRKKANLMNHMIAHSNDRPHICNLCGARYMRRCDLLNHLKLHAYTADDHEEPLPQSDPEDDYDYDFTNSSPTTLQKRSDSTEEAEGLLVPAPSQYRAPAARVVPKKSRTKQVPKSQKRVPTSIIRSRVPPSKPATENKFSVPVEPYVDIPPRFPVTDERKPFVCQKCGVSFAREKALASHYRIHGGDSPFECETCGDKFWDRTMLQDHIRQRHAANFMAPSIEQTSSFTYSPQIHNPQDQVEDEHSEDESIEQYFYCDSCGLSFLKQEQLKRHIKQTHGIKEQKYEPISQIVRQRQQHQQQVIAEEDYNDEEEEYNDNNGNENEPQRPLSCNVCGDIFAEALDLLAHAEIHARFEPHRCQLCPLTFVDEKTIKEHIQQCHSHELTDTSCVICGKFCKNHAALLKHAWEHSRERANYGSHCCSKCGKTFHNKARLKRHMVSHRNKSVKCEVCSEEFPDGRSLMNHRHSHTKTRQFPCHECGKTFGSRSSQQIHLRIHSGERPYGCRFCWKAFADGGTLRKHERVHTGEKPYGCSVCPRAFNQRVVLREHIRSHHSAPDTKRGTAIQPYFCSVCTQLFETSIELIQHLIQHSDTNTAMKRQPPTFPRKYKRRRKLKPDEVEKMGNSKGRMKNNTVVTHTETVQNLMKIVEDEELLKNPAEVLLEYGAGNSDRKLVASSKYVNSYELLASASASHTKPANLDDSGINLLSNVVLVSNPSSSGEKKVKPIKTESPKRRGGKQTSPSNASRALGGQTSSSASGSRPRMIHTQKTRVPVTDGKRRTRTVITKDIKSQPSSNFSPLEFERSRNRPVLTYREIPSERISSESFPLLDDGREVDADVDDRNQEALDVLTTSTNKLHQHEVPSYEDLLNQNLLMEISRKDKFIDKFNSDIVNDLEEILRSPIKCASNSGPPAVIMATPKANRYNNVSHQKELYDQPTAEDDTNFTAEEEDPKPSKTPRKQQPKKITKESAQRSLTSALRSQRLTRRQLEREVNFLREAYAPDLTTVNIKQEKDSPDKLSAMLLNDIQTPQTLLNPKLEPTQDTQMENGVSTVPPPQPEQFQCEMCSALFSDRSQLLLHVPIHI